MPILCEKTAKVIQALFTKGIIAARTMEYTIKTDNNLSKTGAFFSAIKKDFAKRLHQKKTKQIKFNINRRLR
jgi:hypothetical protein